MNAIELKGLTKSFSGFTLGPLDLTLPSGCIMGLIGENGAGKSTTLKLLLQILRPDGGAFSILGRDGGDNLSGVKEEIGVVLDEVGLPECLTARQAGRIMQNAYRRWDAEVYAGYLDRLSIPRDKAFKNFSRGNKMKLGIAIALSHHPRLLLLDEATSGLDPVVREEVVEIFSEFTREEDHSILVSSHIVSDLEKLCDYIAFLHRGKLVLCEEKDLLLGSFGAVHCSHEQFAALDPSAVLGFRQSSYGVDAVVRRDRLPAGLHAGPVSIEELFVWMVKEDQAQ